MKTKLLIKLKKNALDIVIAVFLLCTNLPYP